MEIRTETVPEGLVIRLSGELDHHTARQLRDQVDTAVERARPPCLRLDFSGVSFMDSSGIGLIMGRYRLMQSMGGRLAVGGMSERIRRVMCLAGLDKQGILEAEPAVAKGPTNHPERRGSEK